MKKLLNAFQQFTKLESTSGMLLMACAVAALAWANSPWGAGYAALWETKVTIGLEPFQLSKSLLHWINDGLMAVFFFVVGLEIKRELLMGELASVKRATLPIMAALGGALLPASLYAFFNVGQPGASGWGIPMATDIAFSLGVLALLGKRIPLALKILLAALAIADDLGAVLVIAIFYTAEISWPSLAVAGGFGGLLYIVNLRRMQHPLPYLLLGFGLWVAMLKSGVHATIAGVLVAMAIPASAGITQQQVVKVGAGFWPWLKSLLPGRSGIAPAAAVSINAGAPVKSALVRFEHALHPWVAFGIMPLFALANAGVTLQGDLSSELGHRVGLGIMAGLVVGKPIGIVLLAWLAVRLGFAALPEGVKWRHMLGIGMLAGIGFTMSLFVANLAFATGLLLPTAKVGILVASLISGLGGGLLLYVTGSRRPVVAS